MTLLFVFIAISIICFGLVAFRGAPYVPTRKKQVQQAFDELYKISKKDVVIDLGSGDGMLLREAARRGAKAIGYELNPILVVISKLLSRHENIEVKWGDFWQQKLPEETTVIYIFTDGRDVRRMQRFLREYVKRTKKAISVISYAFTLPDEKPQKKVGPMYLYELKA